MKLEEIIKILWHRKFYILFPLLLVPFCAGLSLPFSTKIYESNAIVFIDESQFTHPLLAEFGLKLKLEDRLPSIKKRLRGQGRLQTILALPADFAKDYEGQVALEKMKGRLQVHLKGPGVAQISYQGVDPLNVQQVTQRLADHFIEVTLTPFAGAGLKLKEKLKQRDEILQNFLWPNLARARASFHESRKNYNPASPEFLTAQYEFKSWLGKTKTRESLVEKTIQEILPLNGNELAVDKIASMLKLPTLPLRPSQPQALKTILLAIATGFSIGMILVFLIEFLDHSFKDTSDLEAYLDLSVIGHIPPIQFLKKEQA